MILNKQEVWWGETDIDGACTSDWRYWDSTGERLYMEEIRPERDTWLKIPKLMTAIYIIIMVIGYSERQIF